LVLVGESGSGKTTLGKAALKLLSDAKVDGEIKIAGQSVTSASPSQLRSIRRLAQIIFQDPFASLDPRMTIGESILEGMQALGIGSSEKERKAKMAALLERVGLPREAIERLPHEFSGGQRQRVAIARALAVDPKLIVCDEPTSALDVSVQAQILNLMKTLQRELGIGYLFITHNFAVVEYMADTVAVMQKGRIVEYGRARDVLDSPRHPYTQRLLAAVPSIMKSRLE
jgi:peptide/nickel transport system ATP-binding protein